jgi:hypothetical protein
MPKAFDQASYDAQMRSLLDRKATIENNPKNLDSSYGHGGLCKFTAAARRKLN